jgi:hypothetical protein
MRIPGADQAIGHLIKWSEKDQWEPYRRQVFAEHFELIMERFDISEQEIVDLLDEAFGMICGFVLEDFFTARFGEEGELNVVDDYLKRRGWREKVPAKRYLEALRDSVATLYEVVDLDPGQGMTVRDVILGGDPVSVEEKLGSQSAARWDRIAGRIVTVNGKRYFTGALLLFSHHVADDVLSAVDRMAKRLKGELRRNAKKQGEPAEINDHGVRQLLLSGSVACRLLTQTWLVDALDKAQAPLPEIRNTDGEEIVFSQVRFPIVGGVAKIAAILDRIDRFERDDADELRWSLARAGFAVAKDVTKPERGPDIRIGGRRWPDQPRQRRDRRRCPHTKHQLQGTRGARARPSGFSPRRVGRPRPDLASGFAEDARGAPEVDIFRARPTARGGRTGHPLLPG